MKDIAKRVIELNDDILIGLLKDLHILIEKGGAKMDKEGDNDEIKR